MQTDSNKKEVKANSFQTRPKLTYGQRLADKISSFGGSWTFIIIFISVLISWIIINSLIVILTWDPKPFILLNLTLSCIAALQAPIILMSQNRAAERDRTKAERDYYVNRKSEREIENIQKDLSRIERLLHKVLEKK